MQQAHKCRLHDDRTFVTLADNESIAELPMFTRANERQYHEPLQLDRRRPFA